MHLGQEFPLRPLAISTMKVEIYLRLAGLVGPFNINKTDSILPSLAFRVKCSIHVHYVELL